GTPSTAGSDTMSPGDRAHQLLLLLALGVLAWLGMMAVHEAGHVVGAWATGGDVVGVAWHPFALSRTDVDPNPSPLVVVWSGPAVGVAGPLAAYLVAATIGSRAVTVAGFFAGF